jgi:hypothetical protein
MNKLNHVVKSFLMLAIMVTGIANGQDRWELLYADEQELRYIDTQSIVILGPGRYLIWQKIHPAGSNKQKFIESLKGRLNSDKFAYIIARHEIDCSMMKQRIHSDVYYADDGKIILSNRELSKWYDLPPGSVGEVLLKKLCTKGTDAKEM